MAMSAPGQGRVPRRRAQGPAIVVVGPCGSGKSTLVATLIRAGYGARAVAQEHSIIPDLWQHGGHPAALIVLEASPETITRRRGTDFPAWLHQKQLTRLASARAHADLVVPTDEASPEEVAATVLSFLRSYGVTP